MEEFAVSFHRHDEIFQIFAAHNMFLSSSLSSSFVQQSYLPTKQCRNSIV